MKISSKHRTRLLKYVSVFVLQIFLGQLFIPTAMALTSGPTQPEFSSFEPVATTNMVNDYTGDLTYNLPVLEVPGPDGSSYAMSLSYHSGTTPEEEASWVGYGWTLNPGAINRNKRGFPDDWEGEDVTFWNKMRPNTTFSLTASATIELFSALGLNAGGTVRLNNYTGFATSQTFGLSFAGVSLGYTYEGGDGSFSLQVNPSALLSAAAGDKKKADNEPELCGPETEKAQTERFKKEGQARLKKKQGNKKSVSTNLSYESLSLNSTVWPDAVAEHTGASVTISMGAIGTPAQVEIGIGGSVSGTINWQKNTSDVTRQVYGYMYSDGAVQHTSPKPMRGNVQTDMMDYYVEKGGMFSKRDMFIGIPFSNADLYSVTGEGIGGGFRPYSRKVGVFAPNYARSTTTNITVGIEAELGLNMGGGATIMGGDNQLSVSSWPTPEEAPNALAGWSSFDDMTDSDDYQATVMRFTNDLGGAVLYDGGVVAPFRANNLAPAPSTNQDLEMRVNTGLEIPAELQGTTVGRSSYIGYTLLKDMDNTGEHSGSNGTNYVHYRSYQYGNTPDMGGLTNGSQIGEFSVVNSEGLRYNYGLPLINSHETSLSYDLVNSRYESGKWLRPSGATNNANRYRVKVGQESTAEYTSAYLLTSITTPDYIDRDMDGFTPDDFGGYTSFSYTGTSLLDPLTNEPVPYNWRLPYYGLDHVWNSLSDPKDDLGTFSSGKKEIKYLETVETKTHYAVFKKSDRLDGIDALLDNNAMNVSQGRGNVKLKRLDRIELWSKGKDLLDDGDDILIKVTHFEYGYDAWPNTPNSEYDSDKNPNQGRLTLKKVWFESQGIVKARIAPYQFEYHYPHYPEVTYPTPYQSLEPENYVFTDGSDAEVPPYSSGLDAWGNYQLKGGIKKQKDLMWVDQSPGSEFDPAAWQLKNIILPSGGQIHVQYEQDDYAYVQDQEAHAMVPILTSNSNGTLRANDDSRFTLDLSRLHRPPEYSAHEFAEAIAEKLNRIYGPGATNRKKIFFKHLFRLVDNQDIHCYDAGGNIIPFEESENPPWFNDCNMDYITGYCLMNGAIVPPGTDDVEIHLVSSSGVSNHILPGDVCLDFVKTQREGMLDLDSQCDPTDNNSIFPESPGQYGELFGNFIQSLTAISTNTSAHLFYCLRRCNDLSYFRIPVVNKLGGGLRVKRLLMYDKGMPVNQGSNEPAVLYGTEYVYKVFDEEQRRVVSSGVAASEPAAIRDECVLMQPLPRGGQSWLDRVISGKDRKQMEGPLGESILPSSSVGYSQVISKNIHSGQTDPGFKVSNFLTAKDHPMKVNYTPLSSDPYISFDITTGFFNLSLLQAWLSQGFSFEKYDAFYGKASGVRDYSGDYLALLPSTTGSGQTTPSANLISSVGHEYFPPEVGIPVFKGFGHENGAVTVQTVPLPMGKEMDLAMESKIVMEEYKGISTEFDIDFGLITMIPVIIPQGSGSGSVSISNSSRRANATSKVINYPAVLKKTTAKKDQFTSVVENIAFDKNTGNPIITQTNDEYHGIEVNSLAHQGLYTSYSIPAGMHYKAMNQKAENERVWIKPLTDPNISSVTFSANTEIEEYALTFEGGDLCNALSMLSPGTLLEIHDGSSVSTVGHVKGISGNTVNILPTSYNPGFVSNSPEAVTGVHILQSANTNVLSHNVGEFTTYGEEELDGTYFDIDATDPNIIAKRAFVQALNDALPEGTVNQQVTEGLLFRSHNECYTLDGPIEVSSDNGGFTSTITLPGGMTTVSSENLISNGTFDGMCTVQNNQSCIAEHHGYPEFKLGEEPDCVLDWQNFLDLTGTNLENPELTSLISPSSIVDLSVFDQRDNNTLYMENSNGMYEGVFQTLSTPLATGTYRLEMDIAYENEGVSDLHIMMLGYNDHVVVNNTTVPSNIDPCVNEPQFSTKTFQFNVSYGLDQQLNKLTILYGMQSNNNGIFIDNVKLFRETDVVESCSDEILVSNESNGPAGSFAINEETGLLEYREPGNDCFPVELECLQFCNEAYPKTTIHNVVSSSANELSDNWTYSANLYGGNVEGNVYQHGRKGKWRTSSSSGYNTDVSGLNGVPSPNPIYNRDAGVYTMDLYNWLHPSANDPSKWLCATKMTEYSPNGNLLEEQNLLGIKSAVKFGYNKTMPIIVAQNAGSNSIMFESFENTYSSNIGNVWENGIPAFANAQVTPVGPSFLTGGPPHTGSRAVQLDDNGDLGLFSFEVDNDLQDRALLCKVWIKTNGNVPQNSFGNLSNSANQAVKFQIQNGSTEVASGYFEKVAEVGQWSLFQAEADLVGIPFSSTTSYTAHILNQSGMSINLDDVVIHPKDASITTYVYDVATFRLIASMDDQHFALLYQYNSEGKLIRKQKETERGLKTVAETYYNTPLNTVRPNTFNP